MTLGDILANLFRADMERKRQRMLCERIRLRLGTEDYTCRLPTWVEDANGWYIFNGERWRPLPKPRVRYKLKLVPAVRIKKTGQYYIVNPHGFRILMDPDTIQWVWR